MSQGSGKTGLFAALGLGLCCGLPVILASGALGIVGGALGRAWPLTLLGAGALGYGLLRWRKRVRSIRSRMDEALPR